MDPEWKVAKKMENGAVNARRPLKTAPTLKECMKMAPEMVRCYMWMLMELE